MSDAGAHVILDRLAKRFGPVTAVRELSLAIDPGEFVTLLGPSGSGKSTTLLMLAGFEEPTAGEILIDGRSVLGVPPYRREIGMVFQHYALFPHMTVGENIAFPLKQRKLPRDDIRRRVGRTLDLVRLPQIRDRLPSQLSGGQQQRIAVARALVFEPHLLLMDEPLGALDRQLRETLQLELKELHARLEMTVVYVTHDQHEALTLSDRIAVMRGGKLEQVGTATEIYDDPLTRFVATFVGESNCLEGRVVGRQADDATIALKCGANIRAVTRHFEIGDRCTVLVRPEKIVFAAEIDSEGANVLPARIERVIFSGETQRYELRLADDEPLVMKRPNRTGPPQGIPGERVQIAWHVADTRLVPAGPDISPQQP